MKEGNGRRAPSSEEVVRALRRCWQPVARIQDLEDGPQRSVVLGEALAVFLTESGAPAVVSDRCVHRGASLSMGEVVGDGIQCPYHGWEWDGVEGVCRRIPSLADQSQIPPRARIPAFPARAHLGLVWTVLEEPVGEPPSVPWFDPDRCSRWALGEPFELPVSLGVTIENFRDVAHFAFVHKTTLGVVSEVVEPLKPERDGIEVTMRREMRTEGGDGTWDSLREGFNQVIAPNFTSIRMTMEKGERWLLHAARAVSATESVHYWLEGLSDDFDELTLEEAIESEERLYAEDQEVMAVVEPRELPLGTDTDVSTLADRFTLAYREAFAEFVWRALDDRPDQPRSKASWAQSAR